MYITIPGFESLSKQEIFDISVKHVLKNGKPSINEDDCCYSGIGCAAAPFIRKEERLNADGKGAWNQLNVPAHEKDFMKELQSCHDDASFDNNFISDFKHNVKELAKKYDLDTSVLG